MTTTAQLFHKGDLVTIASDLGPCMSHFPGAGGQAIVIGSYKDQYGGEDRAHVYTVFLPNSGGCSWYKEHQLTLIEHGQHALLSQWEEELRNKSDQESDIDWIFANGKDLVERLPGASAAALGRLIGITSMWGPHGEGYTFHANSMAVLLIAKPFLLSGDKAGFLKLASNLTV